MWADLGNALPGTGDLVPTLMGSGSLATGSPIMVAIDNGLPSGFLWLVYGFSLAEVGFSGGVLVPFPDVIVPNLPLDGTGGLDIPFTIPPGVPSGFTVYLQSWHPDPGGVFGWAASNGLSATFP